MEELPKMMVKKEALVSTFFPSFLKVLAEEKLSKDYLSLSELELEKVFGHRCPEDLYEHRHKFWLEYYAAQASGIEMRNESIVPTHMPLHIYIDYLLRQNRIYFLLIPPMEYATKASAVLYKSLENFWALQNVSPINEDGSINFKLATLQKEIHVLIDFRLHGSPTQKMHSIVETNEKKTISVKNQNAEEIINQKLLEIEEKVNAGKALEARESMPQEVSKFLATPQVMQDAKNVYPDPTKDYERMLRKMNGEKKTT